MSIKIVSSDDHDFPSVDVALSWLKMQGATHPRLSRLFCAASLIRQETADLVECIETALFPPKTPAADDFHFVCFEWEALPFTVISMPMSYNDRVRTLLERVEPGFRLGNGEPHMARMEPGSDVFALTAWREGNPTHAQKANTAGFFDVRCFPLTGDNVFTLEYLRRERGPFVAGVVTVGEYDYGQPSFHRAAKSSPFRPMDWRQGRKRS